MPTLSDSLASLADQTSLITQLSSLNSDREGPYTRAYLSSAMNIFTTIREAHDHERRLFRFIGEEQGGKGKVVEKRRQEGGTDPAGFGGTQGSIPGVGREMGSHEVEPSAWNDAGVLLKTALKLVDEYNSMPRARAHIISLIESQTALAAEIAQLEHAIEGLGSGTQTDVGGMRSGHLKPHSASRRQSNPSDSLFDEELPEMDFTGDMSINPSPIKRGKHEDLGSTEEGDESELTPEQWLKQEEEHLKLLEKQVGDKRKAQRAAFAKGNGSLGSASGPSMGISPRSSRKPSSSSSTPLRQGPSSPSAQTTSMSSRASATPGMKELGRSQSGRTPRAAANSQDLERSTPGAQSRTASSSTQQPDSSKTPLTAFFTNTPGRPTSSSTPSQPQIQEDVQPPPTIPSKPKSIFDRKRLQARQTTNLAQAQAQAAARANAINATLVAGAIVPEQMASPVRPTREESSSEVTSATPVAATSAEESPAQRPAVELRGTPTPTKLAESTTAKAGGNQSPTVADVNDTTPTGGSTKKSSDKRASLSGSAGGSTPRKTQRNVVQGVEIKSDVRPALATIWSKLGDTLRSGEGAPGPNETLGAAETIDRIANVAKSPLPPPLSPSSASTLSTALSSLPGAAPPPARSIPLTNLAILTCHLLLALLRSSDYTVLMSDMKEVIGNAAKERGWDPALGTKVIYGALAKKVLTIDRRANGGLGGGMIVLERGG